MTLDEALEEVYAQMDEWIGAWRSMGGDHCEGRVTAMEMARRLVKRKIDDKVER